jgi:hypothetical protein
MDGCWYDFETVIDEIGSYSYVFNCSDGIFTDGDGPYIGPTVIEIFIKNYTMLVDYPYNWINASDGIELVLSDDDSSTQSLPFNFTYYNETFSTVYVSSNGYLSFSDPDPTKYQNEYFPSTDSEDRYLIAPFWDDLDLPNGGYVYVKNFSTYWVVEWFNISHYSGLYIGNFEVILYNNGEILFSYELINNTLSYTCGLNFGFEIEFDPSIEYYSEYSGFSTPPPFGNFSILFTPYPPENTSIIINNGDLTTNSSIVTLTLSADLATEMCFRNGTDGAWTAWEPFDTTKLIYLEGSVNNTEYTICVKFRNAAGETSSICDNILYLIIDEEPRGTTSSIPGYYLYCVLMLLSIISTVLIIKKYNKSNII